MNSLIGLCSLVLVLKLCQLDCSLLCIVFFIERVNTLVNNIDPGFTLNLEVVGLFVVQVIKNADKRIQNSI